MNLFIVSAVSLLCLMGGASLSLPTDVALATTTFIGSTIEAIDPAGQSLTIHTIEGDSWTFRVTSPELLKGLNKGDRCSLETDLQGRVIRIVKTASDPRDRPSARS